MSVSGASRGMVCFHLALVGARKPKTVSTRSFLSGVALVVTSLP